MKYSMCVCACSMCVCVCRCVCVCMRVHVLKAQGGICRSVCAHMCVCTCMLRRGSAVFVAHLHVAEVALCLLPFLLCPRSLACPAAAAGPRLRSSLVPLLRPACLCCCLGCPRFRRVGPPRAAVCCWAACHMESYIERAQAALGWSHGLMAWLLQPVAQRLAQLEQP